MNIKYALSERNPLLLLLFFIFLFSVSKTQDYRILPLGNSITQADDDHLSYRYYLWKNLIDENLDFDLIGSQTDNFGGNPIWDPYQGQNFDQDHEGHWGWFADALLRDLPDFLKLYTPDIVLLHAGTNDVLQRDGPGNDTTNYIERTIDDLENLIKVLRMANPQVTIFLAQLIPCDPTADVPNLDPPTDIVTLNTAIADIPTNLADPQSPIILVDQWTDFDFGTDMQGDGVHPNENGEIKMAGKWRDAIVNNLPVSPHIWLGTSSSDWNTAANWKNGSTPSSSSHVRIPSTATNWPVVTGDLTIGIHCAQLTMEGSSQLTVTGDLTIQNNARFKCEISPVIDIGGDWINECLFIYANEQINFSGNSIGYFGENSSFFGGKTDNSAGGYRTFDTYVKFDCVNPFLLKSVKVYSAGSGTNTFFWAIDNGVDTTIMEKIDVPLVAGENRVELNFTITPGKDHHLGAYIASNPSGIGMWRDNDVTEIDFPFYIGDVGYVTRSKTAGFYYYFFDIEYSSTINDVSISKSNAEIATSGDVLIHGNLSVEPNAYFTNASGNELGVQGEVFIKADDSGIASFINQGTFSPKNLVKVEQYLTPDAWHYVSSPISDGQAGVYTGAFLNWWDEPNYNWEAITSTAENLDPMQGYSFWNYTDPFVATFEGTLNDGFQSINVTNQYTGTDGDAGFNLVGNPYASYLDWDGSGWSKSTIDDVVYYWTGVGDGGIGTYHYYVGTSGSAPGVGVADGNRYIPPGQGFMVKANSDGVLSVTNDARAHDDQLFYKQITSDVPLVRLKVQSEEGLEDEMVVRFFEESTMEHDGKYDAYKLDGYLHPQIYSLTPGEVRLAVNTMPELEPGMVVPLGFTTHETGSFIITMNEFVAFDPGATVILEDILTGEQHILNQIENVSFVAGPEDDPNRFLLIFNTLVDVPNKIEETTLVYQSGKNLFVQTPSHIKNADVTVFNMMGQQVLTQRVAGSVNIIPIMAQPGNYLIVVHSDKIMSTHKVYIK